MIRRLPATRKKVPARRTCRSADHICSASRAPRWSAWAFRPPVRCGTHGSTQKRIHLHPLMAAEEVEGVEPESNVLSIAVTPMSAFPGDPVVANMSLTSPAPAGTQVELSWARQGDFAHTVISTSTVHAGDTALSITFNAPQVGGGGGGGGGGGPGGGTILIFARTANSAQYASAFLQVQHP